MSRCKHHLTPLYLPVPPNDFAVAMAATLEGAGGYYRCTSCDRVCSTRSRGRTKGGRPARAKWLDADGAAARVGMARRWNQWLLARAERTATIRVEG